MMLIPSSKTLAITSDSVNYITTAENIAHHFSLRNFSGYIERIHPPGYAIAMALFVVLGVSGFWAAWIVNWISLVTIGIMTFLFLRKLTGRDDWRVVVGSLLVVSNPFIVGFVNVALTETMFTALALTLMWLAFKAGSEK